MRNRGDYPAPVRINAYSSGNMLDSVWSPPFRHDTTLTIANTAASQWKVGSEVPDYFGLNNSYHRRGLLNSKSMHIKGGLSLGRKEKAEVYILPAIGFNEYDGFEAGLLFHNLTVPQNRLRYTIAPMISTRTGDFVGAGSVGYWLYPSHVFREIVPQVDVKTFHYASTDYRTPGRALCALPESRAQPVFPAQQHIAAQPGNEDDHAEGIRDPGRRLQLPRDTAFASSVAKSTSPSYYGLLRYTHNNNRTFNPYSYVLEGQLGPGFGKLTVDGRLRIDYNSVRRGLHLRVFGGKYFAMSPQDGADYSRYYLTSTFSPVNDYLYDGMYFGRTAREGLASRQVAIQEGGGKLSTPLYAFPLGRSDDWLLGFNAKTDLPVINLPIRLYFDASLMRMLIASRPPAAVCSTAAASRSTRCATFSCCTYRS